MSEAVFIIAEAGVNHNGSLDMAKELVRVAKESGADAVKFQTFKADDLASHSSPKAEYQQRHTEAKESQLDMLRRLELSKSDHLELISYCKELGITFLSSPFDLGSLELLDSLGLDSLKIPSGEITNIPFLRAVGKLNKHLIVSTGMATMEDVELAMGTLLVSGTKKERISLLHAVTEYPAPFSDVNLRAMKTLEDKFNCKVGYSDHTPGIEASIAAVALGAKIIEKHFTLDKSLPGPDHQASLDPAELKSLATAIRHVEQALGHGRKEPSPSEKKNMPIARKSIVAAENILAGEVFSEKNLTVKRPGSGISPKKWDSIIGTRATKNFAKDELL